MTHGSEDSTLGPGRTAWKSQLEKLLGVVNGHGVSHHPEAITRLASYCEFVCNNNTRAGLVSKKDIGSLVSKHVAASLGPLLLAEPGEGDTWIDVGTGGGFPGMVIKIIRPEIEMTLLDSSRKKMICLEKFGNEIQLQAMKIVEVRVGPRAAGLPPTGTAARGRQVEQFYDVILMRAVTSLPTAIPLIDEISGPGSRFITFKGEGWQSELDSAQENLEQYGWEFVRQIQIPWAAPKLLMLTKHGREK